MQRASGVEVAHGSGLWCLGCGGDGRSAPTATLLETRWQSEVGHRDLVLDGGGKARVTTGRGGGENFVRG